MRAGCYGSRFKSRALRELTALSYREMRERRGKAESPPPLRPRGSLESPEGPASATGSQSHRSALEVQARIIIFEIESR